jgi:hypothetical protein
MRLPLGRSGVGAFARSGICGLDSIGGVITTSTLTSSGGFDRVTGCVVGESGDGFLPGKNAEPSRSFVIAVMLSLTTSSSRFNRSSLWSWRLLTQRRCWKEVCVMERYEDLALWCCE